MDRITLHDKTFRRYIDNGRIEEAIDLVAEKLNRDYADVARPVMLLSVMNGALMFTGELLKRLNFPLELISIKLRSYSGTGSTGKVVTTMGLTGDVSGRDVLIVEDIVDTGRTMVEVKRILREAGAVSAKMCSLLFKPDAILVDDKVDYVGMEIPTDFIVGFGLDYDELGRNYPDIYILDE